MTDRDRPPTFGYLHIAGLSGTATAPEESSAETPEAGPWVGGYLIVSAAGRPLEFQCTAPVMASRAQTILYGRSLRPFLFGEHLGATLVARAKLKPDVLLIDVADADAAGRGKSIATVLLDSDENRQPPVGAEGLPDLPSGAWLLARGAKGAVEPVAKALRQLANSIDLAEPFERIREAVAEAQQGVSPSGTGATIHDAA